MKDNLLVDNARAVLHKMVEVMDDRLETYWNEELSLEFGFNKDQKELVRKILLHSKDHNLRPAKRLRASFVIEGYLLGGGELNEKILKAAEAVELVHTALLIHDDFMDEDKLRRGLPTTHEYFAEGDKHYGDSMAVNVGDSILCLGYQRLLECGFDNKLVKQAMAQLLRGITNTAFGQAYDVSLPKFGKINEQEVLDLHRSKTAIYTYENPLFIGIILAGVYKETNEILKEYSSFGGVAFQIQDDILGVYGDEGKTGKSADSDIKQGKITLLMVKAFEMANAEQIKILEKVWGNKLATNNEIDLVKKIIKDCGSYDYSVFKAKDLANKAADISEKLRLLNLNSNAVDFIEGVARYMVLREL